MNYSYRLSYISIIAYFYIIILLLISRLLIVSDIYKSLLALPGLLIVPYLVGKPVLLIIRKFLSIKESYEFIVESVITWSIGVIFIIVLEVFLYTNYLFSISSFVIVILLISIASLFIKENFNIKILKSKEILLIIVYGLLFSIFITNFWGYPYANGNDYITHTYQTIQIVEKDRPLIFYEPYLPTMHTLYAVLLKLFDIKETNALYLLWSSRFIFYPVYALGLFLFFKQISNNKLLSFIAMAVGISLVWSNSQGNSILPWITAPKNIISMIFPYALYVSLNLSNRISNINQISLTFIPLTILLIPLLLTFPAGYIGYGIGYILIFIFLFTVIFTRLWISHDARGIFLSLTILLQMLVLFHKIQGFIMGFIIIILIIFYKTNLNKKKYKLMLFLLILFDIIYFSLLYFDVIQFPQKPIFSSMFVGGNDYGFNLVLKLISSTYPFVLIILFIAGCILAIVKEKNRLILALLPVVSLIFLWTFFPALHHERFLMYLHPFIIFFSIYCFIIFIKMKEGQYTHIGSHILIAVFIISIGLIIYTHDIQAFEDSEKIWDHPLSWQKYNMVFEIGEYIKNHVSPDAVTLYYTSYQEISSYYGQSNVIFYKRRAGKNPVNALKNVYLSNNSSEAHNKLINLLNDKEYFVLYSDPYGKDIERFYKRPKELILLYDDTLAKSLGDKTDHSLIKFFDTNFFDLLYVTQNSHGDRFYVFRIKIKEENNYGP